MVSDSSQSRGKNFAKCRLSNLAGTFPSVLPAVCKVSSQARSIPNNLHSAVLP